MRWLACGALCWLLVAHASAQASPGLELSLDEAAARSIDADALCSALERELTLTITRVEPTEPRTPDLTRLDVHGLGTTRLRLELQRADGTTLRRTTRLLPDPDERVATVVILAANLVRDEAGELLALLRRPPPEPEPAPEPPPEPVVVQETTPEASTVADPVVEPTHEVATPITESSAEQTSDPTDSGTHDEAATEPALPTLQAPTDPPSPSVPRDPFLRLGLNAQLGSAPRGAGYDLAWVAGFEVAATPFPFLAIGLRELSGGYATTGQWAVGAAPFAELAWRFTDWGDLHGAIGAHVEYIAGDAYASAGAAPFVLVGARLYVDRIFSIALETTIRYVATNTYHAGTVLLPQGAVLWTGGLSISFHVS